MQITRMDSRWHLVATGTAMDGRPWRAVVLDGEIDAGLVALVEKLTAMLNDAHYELARAAGPVAP